MRTKYERDIYLFLSLYRFFAYSLAVVLIQALPGEATELGLQTYLLLATMGVYTLVKGLGPLRWWQRDLITYVVLGGDLVVALIALLLTGGLTSGFLLYSFIPVITAALLFEERLALLAAGFCSTALVVAHGIANRWTDQFVWIMEGNYLLWLIFYIIASFLVATSVYRTNLNISQRIQRGAIVEERRRMRREIHDGVAQALSYLSMKADTVSKLVAQGLVPQATKGMVEVRQAVSETYKSVRESLDQLSVEVGTLSLKEALEEYLHHFQAGNNIQARLETQEPTPRLSPVAELQVLRVAQEALSNIRKHAQATNVCVTWIGVPGGAELRIKDDGRGFIPSSQSANGDTGHHGLSIMKERAEGLGGTLSIHSTPGEGTEVRVFVPRERAGGVLWSA
ncbi:MAG: sensor histidine kinase [Chloroflexi bacterium]|nr:sensor histidine kinase [Chloroflexota bacterium]